MLRPTKHHRGEAGSLAVAVDALVSRPPFRLAVRPAYAPELERPRSRRRALPRRSHQADRDLRSTRPALTGRTEAAVALPHRIVRLCSSMAEHGLDAVVACGAEHVNHLCGYWRYFGSPPALVVGRDGARTLVVQLDEADEARTCRLVDQIATYGSRGFGLVPDQTPLLVAAVAALPVLEHAREIGIA